VSASLKAFLAAGEST